MAFIIEGPKRGTAVNVTKEGNLATRAVVHELQHYYSREKGQVYQVIGDSASITSGTNTLLHIRNDSTTHAMVVSYVRMQAVDLAGGTVPPAVGTYFQMGFGTTYTSGGTAVTPVNTNNSSGNTAGVTAYDGKPTVGGTFVEIDRWYPDSDADEQTYNKHGSVILGKNDALEIRLVTDNTSGTGYCRITFAMIELEE